MNAFDLSILTFLNSYANRHVYLDVLLVHIQDDNLLKGGVLVAVWWYCWFHRTAAAEQSIIHKQLIGGLMAMVAGLAIARTLAHLLPFRVRPFANPELHFVIPNWNGAAPELESWSSFPSDHAVVWFSIAAAVYLTNKPIGLLTFFYAAFLGVGRIYAGAHHPTDILVGAAIGIAAVHAFNSTLLSRRIVAPVLQWGETRPGLFYAATFLCTYEISNMFGEVRAIGVLGRNALKLFAS